jgi:hypothetical protein
VQQASLTRRETRGLAALAAACALCGTSASAQDRGVEASYFAVKLTGGVGGEVEIEGNASARSDDLGASLGAAVQYMARVHSHFAIGGTIAFSSWQSARGLDLGRGRNGAVDGVIVPAGVLPLSADFELYLAAGVAVSMNASGDTAVAQEVSRISPALLSLPMDVDEAFDFALLPALGARLAVAPGFGVLAELGYALRWYEHDLHIWDELARLTNRPIEVPFEMALGQLTLALGVFF